MAWLPAFVALAALPWSAGALASDNPRTRFRADPALFFVEWTSPLLMNGQPVSKLHQTDLLLHSPEPWLHEKWVDYLYPFAFENEFAAEFYGALCRRWWWMSCVATTVYLLGLWAGTSWMKDREPFDLRTPLALWNLSLAIFSFIGAMRTVPHLTGMAYTYGFEYTLCRAAVVGYGSGAPGMWVMLFIFSKYVELIDTVFLVLRKKKVPFLHWYHHCSVLLYCWHSYFFEMPTGIYFTAMNYSVHAVMYFYYFLAAQLKNPPRWASAVTVMQIMQMIGGIVVTTKHLHALTYQTVSHCDGHIPNLAGALGMYASYFILFAQFFARRYISGGSPKTAKEKLAAAKLD